MVQAYIPLATDRGGIHANDQDMEQLYNQNVYSCLIIVSYYFLIGYHWIW